MIEEVNDIVLSSNDTIAYVAGGNGGLFIVDVSNPNEPRIISKTDVNGFYDSIDGITLSSDEKIAYLSDFTDGMYIVDISDIKKPKVLSHAVFIVGGDKKGIHGDGNTISLSSDGNKAYAVVGYGGLFAIDVSDPKKPTIIGSAVLPGKTEGIAISDDDTKAYIQTRNNGLTIVDLTVFE